MSTFSWAAFSLLAKLGFYLSFAVLLAFVAIIFLQRDYPKYVLRYWHILILAALSAAAFTSLDFFIQVGAFSESGFWGMFDPTYRQILWESPIGAAWELRTSLLAVSLLAVMGLKKPTYTLAIASFSGGLIIISSNAFALIGHLADSDFWLKASLSLHALIGLWWMGSLVSLWLACAYMPAKSIQRLMHHFGIVASFLLVLLLATGTTLAYHLLGSFTHLFTSNHGQFLLLKLAGVFGLFGLASYHKFRLVPALLKNNDPRPLQKSIAIEMMLGLIVLVITSVLSTLIGPPV